MHAKPAQEEPRAAPRPVPEAADWHAMPAGEVAERLGTDSARGLSGEEAARRLEVYGPNALAEAAGRSLPGIIAEQFRGLVVWLLVAAGAISALQGEAVEAAVIGVVIGLNALIGVLTEWRAERALSALRDQILPIARIVRDGAQRQVAAATLVPGDVVVLAEGDRVPADGRVVEAARLQVEEAALTGESAPVSKATEPAADPGAPLAERTGMAYLGTAVTAGRGRLVVTATGPRTELGRIGALIEAAPDRSTPLERKLDELGRTLVLAVLALCAAIVALGVLRGHRLFAMLRVGITLAVAAVPEGLPAVATMTLAIGMQRMARRRAIVRRLPAVETLGSVTVICTDKTGTLTRNEMTARELVAGGRRFEITGAGYSADGTFLEGGRAFDPSTDEPLATALRIGALCNDAQVAPGADGPVALGDPTEVALLVAARKGGIDSAALALEYPRIGEVPFDSRARRMVTVHLAPGGGALVCVKGSPALVLEQSGSHRTPLGIEPLSEDLRQSHLEENRAMAARALRVLALAYRELPPGYVEEDLGRDLVFAGLVGLIDPPRDEAAAAIATCRDAGIRALMITGDQQLTAAEVARQLGIDRDASGRPLRVAHARELEGLDVEGWRRAVAETAVFARVAPEHKLRIVEALQARGEVVAMTGDGVNDAPALKRSDIGVAMGIKGTEVAKEAADLIVTDDNFATVVDAVEQGRIIYANILKFLHYLFSCNLAEVMVMLAAALVGWPIPLLPLQILWMNMVTDVLPALALALEPSAAGLMRRPPRDPRERLLNRRFARLIAEQGALLAACTLAAFVAALRRHGWEGEGLARSMTVAFMTLSLGQIAHAFNVRSRSRSAFAGGMLANGWLWAAATTCAILQLGAVAWAPLRRLLGTVPPAPDDWALIAAGTLAPVAAVEWAKWWHRREVARARLGQ